MYQLFSVIAAATLALPNVRLPVEMWINILRFLDPKSLLATVRADKFWKNICLGDLVLKKTVREEILKERRRCQEEILNPGLLITVQRKQPKIFGSTNETKIVRRNPPTVHNPVPEFWINIRDNKKSGGAVRSKKTQRKAPYKSMMRC